MRNVLAIKRLFRRAGMNEQGSISVMWAIMLPVFIGFIGLGVETGLWEVQKDKLQQAADVITVSTGYAVSGGSTQSSLQTVANSELSRVLGNNSGVTATVIYPPNSGAYSGNTSAVKVRLTQSQNRLFSKVVMRSDPTIGVSAVALKQAAGNACVLALNNTGSAGALTFQGSSTISLNNCVGASNSGSTIGINLMGNSSVSAYSLYSVGGYNVGGSATLTTSVPPTTYGSPIADPLASISTPSIGSCPSANNNMRINSTVTLSPGVYCNKFTLNSHADVTLNPGVYIFDKDQIKINGGAKISGTGVTLILTSSTGSNYANIDIAGGAVVNLTAPTTGTYAGVLFYQDRRAPSGVTNKFNGGSTMNLTGAVYFPNQDVDFLGGNSVTTKCTKIIAWNVLFTGNSNTTGNCTGTGVPSISIPGGVTLKE